MFRSCVFIFTIVFFVSVAGVVAQLSNISQETGVTISVKDTNGAVIPGATVIVTLKGQHIRNAETGTDGTVRIDKLSGGDYRFIIQAKGFPIFKKDVSLKEGLQDSQEFILNPGDISEAVTVTATRGQITSDDTPVPVSVIGREDIERKAVNTVGDIFRTLHRYFLSFISY